MDVYFLTTNKIPNSLITSIKYILNNFQGIKIITKIDVHTKDRLSVDDYDKKIAFNFLPETGNVYKLGNFQIYVDNRYTTMYFGLPYDFFCIVSNNFKLPNAWNIVKTLLPKPETVYNPTIIAMPKKNINTNGKLLIDTSLKSAVFDYVDLNVENDAQ